MANPILVTLIALVIAYALSEILRYFKLPRVIGQISAGLILGVPFLRSLLFTDDVVFAFSFLTNIGIILLFFFVGLEINFAQFKRNMRESALISIFNTAVPLFLGFMIGVLVFKFDNIASLIIGISLSVSSQAISLDILEEAKLLKSKIGNLIMTSGTVDDVFELMSISTILVIFQIVATGTLKNFIINIFIFVLIIAIFRLSLIPFALSVFEKDKSEASLFMGALIIVLALAYLSDLFGVSSLIGALIAGILVRQTLLKGEERRPWRKNALSHSIHVISFGFLVPIFFVNVGLKTDLHVLSANLFLVFVLLIADILGTLGGTIIGVLLSKGSLREGMLVGWGVMPKGDTELVIATIALNSGLININIFSAIIAVAFITTIIAPIAIRLLIKKHGELIK